MKVKLKEYIDKRFDANEKATDLARDTIAARLESMNEWRQTYGDQQKNFPNREEVSQQINSVSTTTKELTARLGRVEQSIASLEGRLIAGGVGVAIFSLVVTIVLHFIK